MSVHFPCLDKVLDEQTFVIKTNLPTAIRRLQEMQGPCYQEDSQRNTLVFHCKNNGKFFLKNYHYRHGHRSSHPHPEEIRTYYMAGRVVCENGKTCVKVRTLKNRAAPFVHLLSLLPITMYLAILADTFLKAKAWHIVFVVALVLLAVYVWDILAHVTRERNNKELDLEIMREEITRRIDAIDKWEE